MKFLTMILCTAAVLAVFAALAATADARVRGQRIEVSALPEDAQKPFLMIFTQAIPTPADQFALDSIQTIGVGADVRYHHITPRSPHYARWEPRHTGKTPYIALVSPDKKSVLVQVRAADMPSTSTRLKGRLFPIRPWRRRVEEALNRPVVVETTVAPVVRDTLPAMPGPEVTTGPQDDSLSLMAVIMALLGGGAAGAGIQHRKNKAA
jgi:hypothetical protein